MIESTERRMTLDKRPKRVLRKMRNPTSSKNMMARPANVEHERRKAKGSSSLLKTLTTIDGSLMAQGTQHHESDLNADAVSHELVIYKLHFLVPTPSSLARSTTDFD
ncbi:hypothetical protein V1477_000946 [Vespula maculifrons]|uniref:Uncharacterized protein n=1 Tax=Vespula maculifrons TaxID=7453 RepID=A0ABD2D364_VESMC